MSGQDEARLLGRVDTLRRCVRVELPDLRDRTLLIPILCRGLRSLRSYERPSWSAIAELLTWEQLVPLIGRAGEPDSSHWNPTDLSHAEDGSPGAAARIRAALQRRPALDWLEGDRRCCASPRTQWPSCQVTRDLASSWSITRPEKRDAFGCLPQAPWPEDPTSAEPTDRARRKKALAGLSKARGDDAAPTLVVPAQPQHSKVLCLGPRRFDSSPH